MVSLSQSTQVALPSVHRKGNAVQAAGQQSEGRDKIAAEERKLVEVTRQESELVNLRLQELVSQEALEQSAALLRARRTDHQEEIARQEEVLATSEQAQAAVESLAALRARIADRLDSATPEDRRQVLEVLDTRITMTETDYLRVELELQDGLLFTGPLPPSPVPSIPSQFRKPGLAQWEHRPPAPGPQLLPSLFASVRTGSSPFPGGHGALSVLTASNCSTRPATSLEQARAPLDPLAACQPTLQMGAYARH